MQALQRSGVGKTQLNSLYMTYWKSNIIFTNSTRKPLQKVRNWLNGMAKSICLIKSILPLPWQLKHKIRLFRAALWFQPPLNFEKFGEKSPWVGPICVGNTTLDSHHTSRVIFTSDDKHQAGWAVFSPPWLGIEITQFHVKPFQCLPQEAVPLRPKKVLILQKKVLQVLHESCRTEMGS